MSDCRIDGGRLGPIAQAKDDYGLGEPGEEWARNIISSAAVAYSCGAIARSGEPVDHEHDPAELALCRRLAEEAAGTMAGLPVGMGSEARDGFEPFFVAAARGSAAPAAIDEALIRRAFGGTIHPGTAILVEPLEERGRCWSEVMAYFEVEDGEEPDPDDEAAAEGLEDLERWRGMIGWFRSRPDLHGSAFVRIGEDDGESPGCVFLRLAVGLTAAGSLAGLCGICVLT